jgi:hypothetical protein
MLMERKLDNTPLLSTLAYPPTGRDRLKERILVLYLRVYLHLPARVRACLPLPRLHLFLIHLR